MNRNQQHTNCSEQEEALSSCRDTLASLREKTNQFSETAGRRPRILVSGMESSCLDQTIKSVASFFSDSGFDVDISLVQQSPRKIAEMAVENDVHFVCISTPGNVTPTHFQLLTDALKSEGGKEIAVIICGENSKSEQRALYRAGVSAILSLYRLATDTKEWFNRVQAEPRLPGDWQYYVDGVLQGDKRVVSQTITLIESSLPSHLPTARKVIDHLLPRTGHAMRIGISGVPGVGKSTFIESFGKKLIREGYRAAVLAIDPSSSVTGGSIMGDKTRMMALTQEQDLFIRPSPAGTMLGGVARKTRETLVVCEAAGFDMILVETVGVGQSETTVASMVDFFLVMLLAGAGDEIQGIKKGILELADAIAINKADGDNIEKAKEAKRDYQSTLSILYPSSPVWTPPVLTCSALTLDGLDEVWKTILDHRERLEAAGELDAKRKKQALAWMWDLIQEELKARFFRNKDVMRLLPKIIEEVKNGKTVASVASDELLSLNE
jgi:LAO/AO transport system kinase